MAFLDDQLPKALLDAVRSAGLDDGDGGGHNGNLHDGSGLEFEGKVWESVASQYPLTGLWPLAIILAFTALAILSILLKVAWSLARAKLSFYRVYKIHYGSRISLSSTSYTWDQNAHTPGGGKTRILVLPAEGSVLLCLLVSCVATVARAVSIETKGRLAWISTLPTIARAVEFSSLWLGILFLVAGSICHIPLFTSHTSPARLLSLPEQTTPHLPKSVSKPVLHPLFVNALVFLVPIILCLLPNLFVLSRSLQSINGFQDFLPSLSKPSGRLDEVIGGMALPYNGTNTEQRGDAISSITNGIHTIVQSWQTEGYIRALSAIALLLIIVLVEYAIQKRLSTSAAYLAEVEQAALDEPSAAQMVDVTVEKDPSLFRSSIQDDCPTEDKFTRPPPPQNCITRTRSILSASSRGARTPSIYPHLEGPRRPQSSLSRSCIGHGRPSSRASSYRSCSAASDSPSRLYVPELPEWDITLPSPSLIKDDLGRSIGPGAGMGMGMGMYMHGASPYSPALALFGDRLDRSIGRSQFDLATVRSRTPSLYRGTSLRSDVSSLHCSEKQGDHLRGPKIFEHSATPLGDDKTGLSSTEDDYFGDGKLPYDTEDGYDAQLDGLEYGAAVAHMLNPYAGLEDQQVMPLPVPSYMRRKKTERSHLSRSYTPGLYEQRRQPRPSPALSAAPSSFSRRSHSQQYRPQSRASSYSYHTHSSGASTFSYASSRTAVSWRSKLVHGETYQGPTASHLTALKKSRAIDAALMVSFVLFQGLLDLLCGIAGDSILNAKVLQASTAFASMSLKVLPILGGVILSALRSSSPAYGWHSRHVLVRGGDDQQAERMFDDGASYRGGSVSFEKGVF